MHSFTGDSPQRSAPWFLGCAETDDGGFAHFVGTGQITGQVESSISTLFPPARLQKAPRLSSTTTATVDLGHKCEPGGDSSHLKSSRGLQECQML